MSWAEIIRDVGFVVFQPMALLTDSVLCVQVADAICCRKRCLNATWRSDSTPFHTWPGRFVDVRRPSIWFRFNMVFCHKFRSGSCEHYAALLQPSCILNAGRGGLQGPWTIDPSRSETSIHSCCIPRCSPYSANGEEPGDPNRQVDPWLTAKRLNM